MNYPMMLSQVGKWADFFASFKRLLRKAIISITTGIEQACP